MYASGCAVGVAVTVGTGVALGLTVRVGVGEGVGVDVGVAVRWRVAVGLGVDDGEGGWSGVGTGDAVAVGLGIGLREGVALGVGVGVGITVGVGEGDGDRVELGVRLGLGEERSVALTSTVAAIFWVGPAGVDGNAVSTAAWTKASISGVGVMAEVWPHARVRMSTRSIAPVAMTFALLSKLFECLTAKDLQPIWVGFSELPSRLTVGSDVLSSGKRASVWSTSMFFSMPNWKNVIKNIAESVEEAAREAHARERARNATPAPKRTCATRALSRATPPVPPQESPPTSHPACIGRQPRTGTRSFKSPLLGTERRADGDRKPT